MKNLDRSTGRYRFGDSRRGTHASASSRRDQALKITVPILVAVSAATLLAPAVSAAPDPSGVYDITGSTGKTGVWTITSNCADQGCIAHVSSSSGLNGDAMLSHGLWTLTVPRADAVTCPDGLGSCYLEGRVVANANNN
jgi:hypothetical protein